MVTTRRTAADAAKSHGAAHRSVQTRAKIPKRNAEALESTSSTISLNETPVKKPRRSIITEGQHLIPYTVAIVGGAEWPALMLEKFNESKEILIRRFPLAENNQSQRVPWNWCQNIDYDGIQSLVDANDDKGFPVYVRALVAAQEFMENPQNFGVTLPEGFSFPQKPRTVLTEKSKRSVKRDVEMADNQEEEDTGSGDTDDIGSSVEMNNDEESEEEDASGDNRVVGSDGENYAGMEEEETTEITLDSPVALKLKERIAACDHHKTKNRITDNFKMVVFSNTLFLQCLLCSTEKVSNNWNPARCELSKLRDHLRNVHRVKDQNKMVNTHATSAAKKEEAISQKEEQLKAEAEALTKEHDEKHTDFKFAEKCVMGICVGVAVWSCKQCMDEQKHKAIHFWRCDKLNVGSVQNHLENDKYT